MQCLLLFCPGNEGLKLPAPNRTAHSQPKSVVLLNFMFACLVGATTEECSEPLSHVTFCTPGLDSTGFQHLRAGE